MTRRSLFAAVLVSLLWPVWASAQVVVRPALVSVSQSRITPGSGTGVTVNDVGSVRRLVYKVTVSYTQFVAAATTADFTVATLPAKTRLVNAYADVTAQFACASSTCTTSTLSATLGTSAGGNQVLASFDLDAAAALFGDADAEMGTGMTRAAQIQGALISWAGTALVLRVTSGTGNIGNGTVTNFNAGSVTFYLITEVLP